ncbi:MAG TPA: hypothetical protein DDW17_06815, partial [Deltaproteobacteria bacterium]|nr:hypothetical protein [Deltaproteobacteria bacterium]
MKDKEKFTEQIQSIKNELQNILDSLPIMIFYKDKKNNMLRVNKVLAKTLGLSPKKIAGMTCFELFPKKHAEKYWEDNKRVISSGQPLTGILEEIKTPKGTRWVRTDKVPYKDEKGNIIGIIGFAVDITKQMEMETELMDSEEQYRKLFEESVEGIVLADIDTGIIIDCNKALLKLVERERDEVIGKPQKILHPPEDDIGNVSKTFEKHRKDKRGQTIETRVITKTGKLKDVEIKANITEVKGRKLLQGIFRDITERKQMEEALRASEENFRNSMDNSPLGIRIVTEDGKTIYANKVMLDMYGYDSLDELNAIPVRERYTPESYIEHQKRKEKRRRGEPVPSSYEISIVRKNGKVRHLLVFRREALWNRKKEFQIKTFAKLRLPMFFISMCVFIP